MHSDVRDLSVTPRKRPNTGLDVTFDTKWREKNSRFLGGFFFISAPILMISVLLRIELGHSTKRPI